MRNYVLFVTMAVLSLVVPMKAASLVADHKAESIIVVPQGTAALAGEPMSREEYDLKKKIGEKLEAKGEGKIDAVQWYTSTVNSVSVAASEMQKYIEKSTGAKLEIVTEDKLDDSSTLTRIFIGPCKRSMARIDAAKIKPEGYVIKTNGKELYIIGRDKTDAGMDVDGTLNGAYAFLEKFVGVRWIMPQPEVGEVVPVMASLSVGDIDIKEEPLLQQRRLRDCERYGHTDRIPQLLKDLGVSIPEWEKFFTTQITGAWCRHQRLGARVKLKYTHAYNGWWDRYHEKYPDIFAMQPDGTRNTGGYREQLCVSNPQLWELIAAEKIKELKEDPFLTAASISPNDGGGSEHCCCEKCRAWDPPQQKVADDLDAGDTKLQQCLTDRYFRFYNEIAKRVAKEMPDRYLGTYAYSIYKTPPVIVKHLEKNLIVGYVGFYTYLNEKERQRDREEWLKWSKLAQQLFLRPNLFYHGMGLPVNYTHKFADDIRFMADHGMMAADFDGLISNWGPEGLNYYVAAKLLWNPYANVNSIVDDYCKSAYGKGAPAMKIYYDKLEKLTNEIASDGSYTNFKVNAYTFVRHYTDDSLKELQKQLDAAVAAIGTSDPGAVARVKLVATGLDYGRHVRDLIMAAYAVRIGKSTKSEFEEVRTREDKYFASMALNWSVSTAHNYSYIRMTLTLKPIKQ